MNLCENSPFCTCITSHPGEKPPPPGRVRIARNAFGEGWFGSAMIDCPACHGTGERSGPAKSEPAKAEPTPAPSPIRWGRYRGRWGAEHEVSPVAGNPNAVLVGAIDTGTLMSTGKFNSLVAEGKLTPIEEGSEPIRWGRYRGASGLEYEIRGDVNDDRRVMIIGSQGEESVPIHEVVGAIGNGILTYLGPADEPEPESPLSSPPIGIPPLWGGDEYHAKSVVSPPIGVRLLMDQLAEVRERAAVNASALEEIERACDVAGIDGHDMTTVERVRTMASHLLGNRGELARLRKQLDNALAELKRTGGLLTEVESLRGRIRDAMTALKQTEAPHA